MAAITAYPTTKTGCYKTLEYTYTHTIVSNANPMAIEVDVLINGAVFRTLYLAAFDSLDVVGTDYIYTFKIDVSEVVQAYFDNHLFMYDDTVTYPFTSENLTANVVLDVYRYIPDSAGVLTKTGSATRGNSRLFFNSLKDDLTDYTKSSGRKFMTKNTDYRLSSQVNNLLAFFADSSANVIRINKDDTLTDITLTDDQINIINLNDYFSSGANRLTVFAGTLDGGDFTITGEVLTYSILADICEPIGLHYQNELGTNEVFIFKDYEYDIQREIDRDYFVSADNLVRMNTGEIEKVIQLNRNGFFNNEWNTFKDVATSSVFKIEDSTENTLDEVYPTFNNAPFRSRTGEIDITLTFSYSTEQKIFNN